MPGTIKIGNEGFRSTIKTDSNNNLVLSTPNSDSHINFFSGSTEEGNVIRFIQNVTDSQKKAIIHLSASDASQGGYNIDTPYYDRLIRSNRDMFVTSNANVFNVGMVSGSTGIGYEINNSIGLGNIASRKFFIEEKASGNWSDAKIHMSASEVCITGSLVVRDTISATKKSFIIDHPDIKDSKLHHGSLEGPEFGVYFRGKIDNDNKFMFPDYWGSLVDETSVTVHLTPIGRHILPLYVKEVSSNYVYVNKKSNFYYYVCGERKDIEKLKIIQKK